MFSLMTDKQNPWIDELVNGFELKKHLDNSSRENEFHGNHRPITIWIPIEAKSAYGELQAQTRNAFGKYLREVIVTTIDKTAMKKAE